MGGDLLGPNFAWIKEIKFTTPALYNPTFVPIGPNRAKVHEYYSKYEKAGATGSAGTGIAGALNPSAAAEAAAKAELEKLSVTAQIDGPDNYLNLEQLLEDAKKIGQSQNNNITTTASPAGASVAGNLNADFDFSSYTSSYSHINLCGSTITPISTLLGSTSSTKTSINTNSYTNNFLSEQDVVLHARQHIFRGKIANQNPIFPSAIPSYLSSKDQHFVGEFRDLNYLYEGPQPDAVDEDDNKDIQALVNHNNISYFIEYDFPRIVIPGSFVSWKSAREAEAEAEAELEVEADAGSSDVDADTAPQNNSNTNTTSIGTSNNTTSSDDSTIPSFLALARPPVAFSENLNVQNVSCAWRFLNLTSEIVSDLNTAGGNLPFATTENQLLEFCPIPSRSDVFGYRQTALPENSDSAGNSVQNADNIINYRLDLPLPDVANFDLPAAERAYLPIPTGRLSIRYESNYELLSSAAYAFDADTTDTTTTNTNDNTNLNPNATDAEKAAAAAAAQAAQIAKRTAEQLAAEKEGTPQALEITGAGGGRRYKFFGYGECENRVVDLFPGTWYTYNFLKNNNLSIYLFLKKKILISQIQLQFLKNCK